MNYKKRKILIVIVIAIICILWLCGIIPMQIGKIYGNLYVKKHFAEMDLKCTHIEWNEYMGDYVITFQNKQEQSYSCTIGPKYFPISLGQGLSNIEEEYKEITQ